MAKELLRLERVNKSFDGRQILENLKKYPMDQFSMLRDGSMPKHTPFNRE